MSIRAIELRNFLSFEHAEVKLGKLNILVGPNASGKSNFVKALLFLSRLIRVDVEAACQHIGLAFQKLIYNFDLDRELGLKVHLRVKGEELIYEVAVKREQITMERLARKDGTVLMERMKQIPPKRAWYLSREGEIIPIPFELLKPFRSLFSCIEDARADRLLLDAREALGGFRAYSFEPSRIRSRARSGLSLELARDGSNLAQVLHSLLTSDRKRFLAIEEALKSLIPEVEELNTPTTRDGQMTYITLREKGLRMPLGCPNISDGTLRLLAFITAIHLGGSLVAFEEPENCVHPYLFQSLINICRHGPSQVVITTHSPYLVDKAEPGELLLVAKREGRSIIRRLTAEEKELARKMLEEGFTLGEIWYMGELGGRP